MNRKELQQALEQLPEDAIIEIYDGCSEGTGVEVENVDYNKYDHTILLT